MAPPARSTSGPHSEHLLAQRGPGCLSGFSLPLADRALRSGTCGDVLSASRSRASKLQNRANFLPAFGGRGMEPAAGCSGAAGKANQNQQFIVAEAIYERGRL